MNISFLVYITFLTVGIGAAIYYGTITFFANVCRPNQSNDLEVKTEKSESPEHIEDHWPFLMVTLGKADLVKLQLQKNDIEYEGPRTDSYLTGGPPLCDLLYFEDLEKLKAAGAVVWKTEDVTLEAIDRGCFTSPEQSFVINKAPEIYEFIDDPEEVKIV
jgi:hypothetical protein